MNRPLTPAEALFFEGNRLMSAGRAGEAKACFREAIRLAPDFAEAHTNLGMLYKKEGSATEAEQHYRHAIACNPSCGESHLNLGTLLIDQKRFNEAESACRRAVELMPGSATAWSNLGVLQACRKQDEAAERSYRRAMSLDQEYRSPRFNLAGLLLRQGRFEEGWVLFETRDQALRLDDKLPCPRWRGEPLQGRSVLIGFEAGHGDMIQFCRYAAVLKARGAERITVICHPALKRLFTTLDGVDSVFAADETIESPEWDFWTPPLSMPCYCGTSLATIPAVIPYLRADKDLAAKWAAVLSSESDPGDVRVGLVWKGNTRHHGDADRSLPELKALESLGGVAGVQFFSLQKHSGEEEAATPPPDLPVVNLGPQIADFADSAAIVTNLDLIVCVDTAIAHLAGALGKNCWVLLPDHQTDWRWLSGRSDSPWYPGVMRLFRQPRMGDWPAVVGEVREELEKFVGMLLS